MPRVKKVVEISYALDKRGHWWFEASDLTQWHGPFRTHADAEANAEKVALGPDAKIKKGGVLPPAPKRKQ